MNITNLPKNIILLISTFLTSKYILRSVCKKFYNYIPIYNKYNMPNNVNKINILDLSNNKKIQLPEIDILKIKSSYMFMYKFPKYIRRLVIDEDVCYDPLEEVDKIDELIITSEYMVEYNWIDYNCFNKLKFVQFENMIIKDNLTIYTPIRCKTIEIESKRYIEEVDIDTITCYCFKNYLHKTRINNLNIICDKENIICFLICILEYNEIINTLTLIGFSDCHYNFDGLAYVKNINFENCSEEFITYINKLKN